MADSSATSTSDGTFDKLVNEELAIQRRNLPVNGGLPSCVTLMDNFLLCFGRAVAQAKCTVTYGFFSRR